MIVCILLSSCTWHVVVVKADLKTPPRCVGMAPDLQAEADSDVETVDWWFLLSKQSNKDNTGGGFIYIDSRGPDHYHDIEESQFPKDYPISIKIFWERHIERAYANNKDVYEECVTENKKQTNEEGLVDPTCVNEKQIEAQAWYHDILGRAGRGEPKPTAEDSDHESIDHEEAIPEGTFRHAHAKYLISVDTGTGNGFIIDHSLNIPSITIDTATGWFDPYNLFGPNVGGSEGKFVMSHHSFCTNFQQKDDIDPDGDIDIDFEETTQGATERERLGAFIRHSLNDPINVCLTSMELGTGMTIYGFDIRVKPFELSDPGKDPIRSAMLDNSRQKELGPKKTVIQLGMDPFTYIAKTTRDVYYVSTYSQPGRVDIPSIYMDDHEWGIFNIRGWNYDGGVRRKRHEKLSFTKGGRVCVGDANRNLVHTLYAGIYICFEDITLGEALFKKIHHVDVSNSYIYDIEGTFLLPDTNAIEFSLPMDENFPPYSNEINAAKRALPSLMYPLVGQTKSQSRIERKGWAFIGPSGEELPTDDEDDYSDMDVDDNGYSNMNVDNNGYEDGDVDIIGL
ncbi:hypothetical protein DFA_07965 [Cavenderia fasciculata]|uniref:Uncharacterized protein n=1 Tax=Cavenderia fasciculata TaxID=261658 RepID=F4Q4C2_CACFS|nr:uncharacterized protein DFA_07965 [Cavenderia fasciculata]EGG16984.1 hypothetical protein DFA_07965 [Cavenderia fasciculata]|eukprot:XP_004355466.1 hypothetical protein DFA_07965 [Cavenderia fasciculata]